MSERDLPAGWKEAAIGEVTLPYQSIDPTQTPDGTFTYIDISSIDNITNSIVDPKTFSGRDAPSRARRVVAKGDVLYSTVRPYLKNIAQIPTDLDGALTSTGIAVLRPSSGILPSYLRHWVLTDSFSELIGRSMDGSLYPAIRDSDVIAAPIALPPLPEQRRIVEKIEALTARSRRAREALDSLPSLINRYRQSILAAAFRGDLTAEWRERHGSTPKHSSSNEEPDTLPAGWKLLTLDQILAPESDAIKTGPFGSLLSKADYRKDGVPILGIENIKRGVFVSTFSKFVSDRKFADLIGYAVAPGDVIISRSGTVGDLCVVPNGIGDALISTNTIKLKFDMNTIEPDVFVLMFLGSEAVLAQVRDLCSGSTRDFLNQSIMKAIIFPVPPLPEQREIIRVAREAFRSIDALALRARDTGKALATLDQSILAKAFRGELVPQDPNDEPASVLLERIRAERAAAGTAPRRGRRGGGGKASA